MARSGSVRRPPTPEPPAAAAAFTTSPGDYRLLEEVGHGANAVVYRAVFVPANRVVAVKCLDLDRINSNLDDVRKEAQMMSLIDHPNVIKAFCSFVVDHNLWVVMPFMSEGSCLHLMKVAYPNGFEEPIIASILKETLQALEYLHRQGHIHRDIKAGNILIDSPGVVKLGDFGVSACLFDRGDRQKSRNTFVGTPCWMAPEVLQPGTGYNFKADIWSFGITALELAHGHAPFSKYPPMKVLLMTLQNAPPSLDYDRDRRFSKSFKEMVAMCLVKDQTKRPTAEKLLKHSFFKNAKPPELTIKSILTDLPPLWDRVKAIQLKDAAQMALKRMPSSVQEALSMSEYHRGVSAWNFDIEDLKAQASLICDDDPSELKEDDVIARTADIDKDTSRGSHFGKPTPSYKNNCRDAAGQLVSDKQSNGTPKTNNLSGPLSLPTRASANSLSAPVRSSAGYVGSPKQNMVEIKGRFSVTSENVDLAKVQEIPVSSVSSKPPEGPSLRRSASVGDWSVNATPTSTSYQRKELCNSFVSAPILIPHLQSLLKQTTFQQDLIRNLLSSLQQNGKVDAQSRFQTLESRTAVDVASAEGERPLLNKMFELQSRMISLTDELIVAKLKHTQLQEELNVLYCQEGIVDLKGGEIEEV